MAIRTRIHLIVGDHCPITEALTASRRVAGVEVAVLVVLDLVCVALRTV